VAVKEVSLDRIPSQDAVLYINKSGITFSATFIKKHNLQNHAGVKFFVDDEDPYYLGFNFVNDNSEPNTLSLLASGRSKGGSAGFTIKASELINKNAILKNIQKLPDKIDRTFEINFDKKTNLFSIILRPNFEITVSWTDKNRIPETYTGIYKYIGKDSQVLYIGKGNIKSRANSPERNGWGVAKIQYSVIENDEKCFYWESYYLERFVAANGARPPFNVIMGKSEQ
jgi:hypothetical protein